MSSPAWTSIDRDLLIALDTYESTLCPGCHQPKRLAWHAMTEESWESTGVVCHACSAIKGQELSYGFAGHSLTTEDIATLEPFEIGETTTPPAPPPERS